MMYCAECGSEMKRREYGAWHRCCNGIGYWWHQPPIVTDKWFGEPQTHEGFWLYKTVNWPKSLLATLPAIIHTQD